MWVVGREEPDVLPQRLHPIIDVLLVRLDHGDLHSAARELAVRRRGERLELGHPIVLVQGAVHEAGGPGGALHGSREHRAVDRTLAHLDPLGKRAQVRRGVGAGGEAVTLEDRGDHPRGRRLPVGPDHVDAGEAPLRHAEDRHQLVHAVEPEPHPEQLEIEQVGLGLAKGHVSRDCSPA